MSAKETLYYYLNRLAATDPRRSPAMHDYFARAAQLQVRLLAAGRDVDFPAPRGEQIV